MRQGNRALDSGEGEDGSVSYGKFRNFLLLLPAASLEERDPSMAWFEAATIVPFGAGPRGQPNSLCSLQNLLLLCFISLSGAPVPPLNIRGDRYRARHVRDFNSHVLCRLNVGL